MTKLALAGATASCLSLLLASFAGCGSSGESSGSSSGDPMSSGGSSGGVDDGGVNDGGTAPSSFALSATVVGLQGTGLVLRDKSGAELTVTPQGGATQKVTFATKLPAGTSYEVTVKTQPSSPPQSCLVTGGSGTIVAGDVDSVTVNCTTLYTIGGTVSGLDGKDLILENNGAADSVTINANGQFSFPKPLATGAAYAVTVKQDPTSNWQTCTVTDGDAGADAGASGTIGASNVTSISVSCTTNTYSVAVKVSGLSGSGLVFQNNGGDDLPVAAAGTYAFATKVASGAGYDVAASVQPSNPWQTCTVASGKAKVTNADVTLDVSCTTNTYAIGGTLAGLQGNGLVLQNNAGDDLVLNAGDNGAFKFAIEVASGGPYAITVKTQPNGVANEACLVVSGGSGSVTNADITGAKVECATEKKIFVTSQIYGGNLGGLAGGDAKCQALAAAANLSGNYMAWLSDSTGSPSTRFVKWPVPYKLVDGTVIATGWADLTDGTLASIINKTESGGAPPTSGIACVGGVEVFTNTKKDGTRAFAGFDCTDWTGVGSNVTWGDRGHTDSYWTYSCTGFGTQFCDGTYKYPLYCVQQ